MQTEMEDEAYSNLSTIQNFYFGRSVFITGATGLVGKVLIEKLLRCCPGIGMLYLLVRPKRKLNPEERLDKLFGLELFKKLKEVFPGFRKHVCLIDGDIEKDRLGISDENFEILKRNVSVVFHSAARLKFNDPLKVAIQHNVLGTKAFVSMCHDLPNLVAVVHVSTSYVKRETDGSVLEQVPKLNITPDKIIEALEWMDDKSQQAVEDQLLEGKLTTYLVTKAMGEVVVEENRGNLPTAIVRPCNISPTWKDPFPGWQDSLQSIAGLMLAGAKGVLRALMSVKGLKLNIVPVDLVVNAMVVSAYHIATYRPDSVFVVNSVIHYDLLPLADEDILQKVLKKRDEYPLANMFRYPDFKIYYHVVPFKIHAWIDQWIPAYFLDIFIYIFTGKTILVKVYKKIDFLYDIFYRLGRDPWICHMKNYETLRDNLEDKDKEIFFMETENFDWDKYMDKCFLGGRKTLAREDPSNIPYAKKKAKIWWFVTTVLKWCLILLALYYIIPQSLIDSFRLNEHFLGLFLNIDDQLN